jgi:4-amino-4-deoxy-L-arabinose transferase-like glycosyltransferase
MTRGALRTETPAGRASPRVDVRKVRLKTAVVLAVFTIVFIGLSAGAFTGTSATWDEPIHLTAGYAAAARQDFRIDPSHPPLIRMWASLPTLVMRDVAMDVGSIERIPPASWLQEAYLFAHRFMYVENDADRLLYPARLMIVLLGAGLGIVLFFWARRWLGFVPASIALACYTLEPNLLAHSSLVTTDLGVTCFTFGAIYCTWRIGREWQRRNVACLAVCAALAVLSKFSGVLLVPVIGMLLAIMVARRSIGATRALAVLAIVGLTSFGAVWAMYGFRYLPSASAAWTYELHDTPLASRAPGMARVVEWIDSHRLLPNAFTQGAFYTQASVTRMPAFLGGEIRDGGWWYYFPAAIALKTPIAMLLLLTIGLLACIRRRAALGAGNLLFVLLPPLVYLAVAMHSGVNIGLRHVLPIFPFLILIVAAGAAELLRLRRPIGIAALSILGLAWTTEFARAYPHTLTFFNALAGGPEQGHRHLSDSNLGWGQALKGLKTWMDLNGVSHVNLAYFGQADPAYYGIDCTFLPGSPTFAIDATTRPRLPGYVAISSTTLNGVYAPSWWRLFYEPFHDLEPVAVVGNAIRVYWVEQWPDVQDRPADTASLDAQRSLADALLLGLQWPTQAVRHYRAYLRERPNDTDARVNHGIALVAADRIPEGVRELERAALSDGQHGRAQLMLGKALFGMRDLARARVHAERAAALLPNDADAQHLLARIQAARGLAAASAEGS